MNTALRLAFAAAIAMTSSTVLAQVTQKELVGDWTLVSVVNDEAGKKTEPYGPNPLGHLTLGKNGYFSSQLLRPDLPKIASNNRVKTTPEETEAIAHGILSYFGKWRLVNAQTGEISLHVIGSSFPNWIGADQKRLVTVAGGSLTIANPVAPAGGSSEVVWNRAK